MLAPHQALLWCGVAPVRFRVSRPIVENLLQGKSGCLPRSNSPAGEFATGVAGVQFPAPRFIIMDIINSLISAIEHFRFLSYWIILAIFVLESLAFIGLFVPGAILLLIIGFLSAKGILNIFAVFWAVFIGSLVGDYISFHLGRKGKTLFSVNNKIFKLNFLEKGEIFFKNHGNKSIFLARFIGPLRPVISFVAGLLKMKRSKFYLINTISVFVWVIIFLVLGHFSGQAWQIVETWSSRATVFLLACFLFFVLIYLAEHYFAKKGKEIFAFFKSIGSIFGALKENPEVQKRIEKHPVFFNFLRRRLERSKFRGLPLTFLGFAFFYILFLFFGTTESVITQDPITQLDINLSSLFYSFRYPEFVKVFFWITMLGKWQIVFSLALTLSLIFYLYKKKDYIIALWVSLLGSELFTYLTKLILERPRPELEVYKERFFSFPSGHAAVATGFFGLIFYILIKETVKWRNKINFFFLGLVFIIFLGFSRIYLGAHYLSDVLGGFALGALWMIIGISIIEWLKYRKGSFVPQGGTSEPRKEEKQIDRKKKIVVCSLLAAEIVFYILFVSFYKPPVSLNHISGEVKIIEGQEILSIFSDYNLSKYTETLTGRTMEPLNFIFVAKDEESLLNLFKNANWFLADELNPHSLIKLCRTALFNESYLAAPIAPSFWGNQVHNWGLQKATEKNSVRFRHHIRVWKTNLKTEEGKIIYVATASLDGEIKWGVTHKIDPDIDTEREFIFNDLFKTGFIESYEKHKLVRPVLGKNFVGDLFFTGGEAYLVWLK